MMEQLSPALRKILDAGMQESEQPAHVGKESEDCMMRTVTGADLVIVLDGGQVDRIIKICYLINELDRNFNLC